MTRWQRRASPTQKFALVCAFLFLVLCSSFATSAEFDITDLDTLRAQAKAMFMHGFNSYVEHAYPYDEIRPITCTPRFRKDGDNQDVGGVDLVLGRYQLTMIDSVDTLYVMGEKELWKKYIRQVVDTATFDADLVVLVFETNIRILGGLLSNHLLAVDENMEYEAKKLLQMAEELGNRLMPAFATPTGLPLSKVNLKTGNVSTQERIVCSACAGTYMLEFGLLSKLTGNNSYYDAAFKALHVLHKESQTLNLMGPSIDVDFGGWAGSLAGIGAGTDSLYEFVIKAYILFGDKYFFDMFEDLYTRAMKTTLHDDWYLQVGTQGPSDAGASWVDALSAFWPGMQVLIGDLDHARSGFAKFWYIWKLYGIGLPERFDVLSHTPDISSHLLRPELIESAYMLHLATKDPLYIEAAAEMMFAYEEHAKTECGYALVENVFSKNLEDRMESFFLTETLKYLYLIFTPDHPMNTGNYIFTTEAHPIRVSLPWRFEGIRRAPPLAPGVCATSCLSDFTGFPTCAWPNTLYRGGKRKMPPAPQGMVGPPPGTPGLPPPIPYIPSVPPVVLS